MIHERMLKGLVSFDGFGDEQLKKIAGLPSCHEELYEAGKTVFTEGNTANNVYFIHEGEVNLSMMTYPDAPLFARHAVVETVVDGQFFGSAALIEPYIHYMTAVCTKQTKLISINAGEFRELLDSNPDVACLSYRRLSNYLYKLLRETQHAMITRKGVIYI